MPPTMSVVVVVILLVAAAAADTFPTTPRTVVLSPNNSCSHFGRTFGSSTRASCFRSCFAHADPTVTTSSQRWHRRRKQQHQESSTSTNRRQIIIAFSPRPLKSILSLVTPTTTTSSLTTTTTTTMDVVTPEEETMTTEDDNRAEDYDAEEKEKGGDGDEKEEEEEDKKRIMIAIHTYHRNNYPIDNSTNNSTVNHDNHDTIEKDPTTILLGIGMPKQQFASWVHYYLSYMTFDGEVKSRNDMTAIEKNDEALTPSIATSDNNRTRREDNMRLVIDDILHHVTTQEVDWDVGDENNIENEEEEKKSLHLDEQRKIIREYWKAGKLICESTSLLSSNGRRRKSRNNGSRSGSDDSEAAAHRANKEQEDAEEERQYKLERLREVLQSWAERLTSFVQDELRELDNNAANEADSDIMISNCRLRTFIENEYGLENTRLLLAETLLQQQTEVEQLQTFQSFLNWFRSNFPYYHDKCDTCGVSCKQDPISDNVQSEKEAMTIVNDVSTNAANDLGSSLDDAVAQEEEEEEDVNKKDNDYSFLGYVYPTNTERQCGDASRTELYRCRTCLSYTRFPRYNNAMSVIETKRGRCGEYSMLLYRMLRVLGYIEIRWVVDWSDHVWVEVYLRYGNTDNDNIGRWVHLDPCEAAVDNPLLYESWGKNQTYIVAYHDPFYFGNWRGSRGDGVEVSRCSSSQKTQELIESEKARGRRRYLPVEDVTRQYTSDESHVIEERRGIDNVLVSNAVDEVSKNLVDMLKRVTLQIDSQV